MMKRILAWVVLAVALTAVVAAQLPSSGVIRMEWQALLNRANTWTGVQTFTGGCVGCGGAPGGSDTQVQFNDAGAFGGDAGLIYNKTTDVLGALSVELAEVRPRSGAGNTISGNGAFAVGENNTVTIPGAGGGSESGAFGYGNSVVIDNGGNPSFAFGFTNTLTGTGAVMAFGTNNVAAGTAQAFGEFNSVSLNGHAFGENNIVAGDDSVAVGTDNTVTGDESTAIGRALSIVGNGITKIGSADEALILVSNGEEFTFPIADQADGYVLTTNGANVLALTAPWIAAPSTPTVSDIGVNSCGTTAATIAGRNSLFAITVGATAGTACRVTFPNTAPNTWGCSFTNQTTGNLARQTAATTTTSDVSGTFVAGDVLIGVCFAR
jgi:hypothetical protein